MAGSTSLPPVQRVRRRGAVRAALIWLIALASYSPSDPVWFFNTGSDAAAGELRRPRRRVPRRAVVPAARLRRLPHAGRPRRSSAGTTSGAAAWTRPTPRPFGAALLFACIVVVPVAGVRRARRRRQGVPRRRLPRRRRWRRARGVPEPHRLDHPDPDAALPGDHPVDAVLVRPAVRRDRRDGRATGGRRCSARSAPGARRSGARSSVRRC